MQRLFHLKYAADHGQHDAQVVQAQAGLEHGPGLDQEDFRVIQGNANATPAKEGVVFLDREIGQRLVAANIERAHGNRQRVKGFQLLAIDRLLLLFAGEAILDHERHFSAIKANTFGAAIQ